MYYKNVENGYIESYGFGYSGIAITKKEYDTIKKAASSVLNPVDSYQYKLRDSTLEWELVELPPEPEPSEDPAEIEDYEKALDEMGVQLNGD